MQEKIATAKEEQKTATAKITEVEAHLSDAKGYRERQLKEAKDNMNKAKAKSEKSQQNWKKREQEAEILKLEIEELKKSIENAKQEKIAIENKIETLQAKVRLRFFFIQFCVPLVHTTIFAKFTAQRIGGNESSGVT